MLEIKKMDSEVPLAQGAAGASHKKSSQRQAHRTAGRGKALLTVDTGNKDKRKDR
jgi:hypothetical protein